MNVSKKQPQQLLSWSSAPATVAKLQDSVGLDVKLSSVKVILKAAHEKYPILTTKIPKPLTHWISKYREQKKKDDVADEDPQPAPIPRGKRLDKAFYPLVIKEMQKFAGTPGFGPIAAGVAARKV